MLAVMAATLLCPRTHAQNTAHRVPALVELFTSEGCSDCPPADRLLERLDKEQFVPGADAIVLSEHVTYWNRLGWRDPFSLETADARQYAYGRQFGLSSVYTPQAVVDGAWQFVGSDERSLRTALAKAASLPKIDLTIEDAQLKSGKVTFTLHGKLAAKTRIFVALAADATRSEVARGENAGRTLHHVAVVRAMQELRPDQAEGHEVHIEAGNAARKESMDGALRLVVFAKDAKSGRVLAAAEQTLR